MNENKVHGNYSKERSGEETDSKHTDKAPALRKG